MTSMTKRNRFFILIILCSVSVGGLLLMPFLGAEVISLKDIFGVQSETMDATIFWQMRLPRVLLAFFAGGTFALGGMVFQAIFRNPLVSPFTLGISAGASFGAAVCIWLGFSFSLLGVSAVSIFSFFGALLSIFIVWSLAKGGQGSSTSKMLLAGIAVSIFFVSLIMFVQYLSNVNQTVKISRWLMGGLFVFGYESLTNIIPFTILGSLIVWYFSHELNLFTTGEQLAVSRGVNVQGMIKILFFLISAMVGCVVAVCGPIAFIGIIAPHICRLMIGPDHRYLTPASFLFGGFFLAFCDTLARSLVAPAEMPVGIITALLGGPFFLWLLCTRFSE